MLWMGVCEILPLDVMAPEAHQNDEWSQLCTSAQLTYFKSTPQKFSTVGSYIHHRYYLWLQRGPQKPQCCQIWRVGTCPGQYSKQQASLAWTSSLTFIDHDLDRREYYWASKRAWCELQFTQIMSFLFHGILIIVKSSLPWIRKEQILGMNESIPAVELGYWCTVPENDHSLLPITAFPTLLFPILTFLIWILAAHSAFSFLDCFFLFFFVFLHSILWLREGDIACWWQRKYMLLKSKVCSNRSLLYCFWKLLVVGVTVSPRFSRDEVIKEHFFEEY